MGRDRRSSSIASTRSRNSSFQLPSHAIDFLNGRGRESNLDDDAEDSPQRQRGTCSRPPRASCNKGNGLTRSRSSSIANRDRSPSFAPRAHRGTLTSPNTTPTKRMKDGASRPSFKKKESGSGFRTTHRGAIQAPNFNLPTNAAVRRRQSNAAATHHDHHFRKEVKCKLSVYPDPASHDETVRHWSATIHGDASFFVYPSLMVGDMKHEQPNWECTSISLSLEESRRKAVAEKEANDKRLREEALTVSVESEMTPHRRRAYEREKVEKEALKAKEKEAKEALASTRASPDALAGRPSTAPKDAKKLTRNLAAGETFLRTKMVSVVEDRARAKQEAIDAKEKQRQKMQQAKAAGKVYDEHEGVPKVFGSSHSAAPSSGTSPLQTKSTAVAAAKSAHFDATGRRISTPLKKLPPAPRTTVVSRTFKTPEHLATHKSVSVHNTSVNEYEQVMQRGSKLRRAVRAVEGLNAKAHDTNAIVRRVEKWIPSTLRDGKVAILQFAVNKQLRDQSANIFMLEDYKNVSHIDPHPHSSVKHMHSLNEGEEDMFHEGGSNATSPHIHARTASDDIVGMGRAGEMGANDEGHKLGGHGQLEYMGERARQMFFDRYQRIANHENTFLKEEDEISEENKGDDVNHSHFFIPVKEMRPKTAPERTSPTSSRLSPTSQATSQYTSNNFSSPIDKFLQTCISRNITAEPTIVKKSYIPEKTTLRRPERMNKEEEAIFTMKSRFLNKHHSDTLICTDYGMGDIRALALADALMNMKFIMTLDLAGNRLTDASLVPLLRQLSMANVRDLSLSKNVIGMGVAKAMKEYLDASDSMKVLRLDNCKINNEVVNLLAQAFYRKNALKDDVNGVEELSMTNNSIGSAGAECLGELLKSLDCTLKRLDLSHNLIQGEGAKKFGAGLDQNHSLEELILDVNRFGEEGTMAIASALHNNTKLRKLGLEHNNVGTQGAFVLATNLRQNKTLKSLGLVGNPLGEQGGRCLLRSILEGDGINCILSMTGCTFSAGGGGLAYDHSNPSGNYDLELENPFQMSILHELRRVSAKPQCGFTSVRHFAERSKNGIWGKPSSMELGAGSALPEGGRITFHFRFHKSLPTAKDCLTEKGLETWTKIIAYAKTEDDRKNWLRLVMQDFYVTTNQIENLVDELDSMPSDHMKVDRKAVLLSAWTRILDSENKFGFMTTQLQADSQKELAKILGFTRFKLNFLNPTGHWHLELSNAAHRDVWQTLHTLEGKERSRGKQMGRGDTSQKGNWSNFRNEKFNNEVYEIIGADVDQMTSGTIEFDYVSTTRPDKDVKVCTESDFLEWLKELGITDAAVDNPGGVMFQMYLTHAACQYYFTVQQVCHLVCNVLTGKDQADAAVAMFARVVDLENFDQVLKLSEVLPKFRQNIIDRLGWLNVGNPMKPEHSYELSMKHFDNRSMLKILMHMGSGEKGVHIKDAKKTDIPMQEIYGNGSMLNGPSDKTVRMEYAETKGMERPNFSIRSGNLDKFLVGMKPVRKEVYTVAKQYEELDKHGKVTSGPIARQYEIYMKEKAKAKGNWGASTGKVAAMLEFGHLGGDGGTNSPLGSPKTSAAVSRVGSRMGSKESSPREGGGASEMALELKERAARGTLQTEQGIHHRRGQALVGNDLMKVGMKRATEEQVLEEAANNLNDL